MTDLKFSVTKPLLVTFFNFENKSPKSLIDHQNLKPVTNFNICHQDRCSSKTYRDHMIDGHGNRVTQALRQTQKTLFYECHEIT